MFLSYERLKRVVKAHLRALRRAMEEDSPHLNIARRAPKHTRLHASVRFAVSCCCVPYNFIIFVFAQII